MAARKKRRIRSPHPGVVLIPPDRPDDPDGRHRTWRARVVDPDTKRTKRVRLDPLEYSTAETRRDWAIRKAKEIAKRRAEIEAGAPRATGTSLKDALDRYFKEHSHLRSRTREIARSGADKLEAWATENGIATADNLTRAKLLAFREHRISAPKRAASGGGERGARRATQGRRAPAAINHELRAVRAVLGYLHDLDLLPRLTRDDLRRGLKQLPVTSEHVDYLPPHACQQLLAAALRHDAETFSATREEHAGLREAGSTSRYDPIAPFVAFVLLTGMRFGEAIALDWRQVDLDALDHDGRKVGEIRVRGAGTKTHKARTIGLEVSPDLRAMLAAMQLSSGGEGRVFAALADVKRARRLIPGTAQAGANPEAPAAGTAQAAAKRLRGEYGAPAFTWQKLRRTCGTFLTNAPGIFGAASAYRSAKQLGHSVQVAERHYLDVARGISRDARTLEAAMQIEAIMREVVAGVCAPRQLTAARSVAATC